MKQTKMVTTFLGIELVACLPIETKRGLMVSTEKKQDQTVD